MKNYIIPTLFAVFILFQNITQAQCPGGVLSLPVLQAGSKVQIAEIYEYDDNYKQRKHYIGEIVTLLSVAEVDEECWYVGSFDNDGVQVWFNYFRLYQVEGEN